MIICYRGEKITAAPCLILVYSNPVTACEP